MVAGRVMKKRRLSNRRTMRRRFNISRPMRVKRTMVNAKRTSYSSTWAFGTAATNDFWRYYVWTPNDVNGFSDYAACFDEFKINAVKVTFRPAYDSVDNLDAAGTLTQPQAYAHYIIDPSSTTAPTGVYNATSLNDFLSQGGVKTRTLNRPFSIYLKPKISEQIFGSGTSGRVDRSPWIKTNETGVQYRGFHMFLQQNSLGTGNTNIKLDTFYTFYVSFRHPK